MRPCLVKQQSFLVSELHQKLYSDEASKHSCMEKIIGFNKSHEVFSTQFSCSIGFAIVKNTDCLPRLRHSRDGRDWHHQRVVPVAFQRSTEDGVLPFNGFQHGLLKQVPPLRRTLWGWRGVRVGEASNPGPVETRSARRSQTASGLG